MTKDFGVHLAAKLAKDGVLAADVMLEMCLSQIEQRVYDLRQFKKDGGRKHGEDLQDRIGELQRLARRLRRLHNPARKDGLR